jgi:AraC-like DNA-binding protein
MPHVIACRLVKRLPMNDQATHTAAAPYSLAGAKQRIPVAHFDSGVFPQQERADRWFEVLGGYIERKSTRDVTDFACQASHVNLGGMVVASTTYSAFSEQGRSTRGIRLDGIDHYRLDFQVDGVRCSDLNGRRLELTEGRLVMSDLAQPETFSSETGGISHAVIIPRAALDRALPRPVDLHGYLPGGALGMLLAEHVRTLVRAMHELTPAEATVASQVTTSLIAAAITPSIDTLGMARQAIEGALLRQTKQYIATQLLNPDLSAESICGAMRFSRATLYRIFEPLGGVSQYIKSRRLGRVHRLLSSATRRIPLEVIAADHGFKTAAHFSRAFREQFGCSPSEVQQHGLAVPRTVAAGVSSARFDDVLRQIQD